MAEPNQNLQAIEKEISMCAQTDTSNWIRMYQLMDAVESRHLYTPVYKSFSAWINHMSVECKIHVSTLWARKKAGKVYDDYKKRCEQKGQKVANIEDIAVSPDSLKLCSTVAGKNADELDNLIAKTLSGNLKREDLRKAARAKRANIGAEQPVPTRHNTKNLISGMDNKITASDIVLALSTPFWIYENGIKTYSRLYRSDIYEGFAEFPIPSGTSRHSRRIDYMIFETKTCIDDNICIHGIEIKIDKNDLLNDNKMGEYTNYCDAFYVAIPDSNEMINAAKSYIDNAWGIITVGKNDAGDYAIKLIKKPTITEGIMRDKSLINALKKRLERA